MIPLSIAVLMGGLCLLQWQAYHLKQKKDEVQHELDLQIQMHTLKKEFDDYKKRVDTLTLKAGFKL